MYGHNPNAQAHHYAYGHQPYNAAPLATTSGNGPMRGGPWPAPSTGLDLESVKKWMDEESLGVKHKWWALGIGTLAVGALVYHGRQKRWF